jgi:hypothetical protein
VRSASSSQAEYEERREVVRLEVERHEVQAFHRTRRRGGHERGHPGCQLVHHPCLLLRPRDPGIGPGHGGRRRARLPRFPGSQRTGGRILGQQERQRCRARPGQAEADQRALDPLGIDLRVAAVPVLDLQPVRQQLDDQGA